MRIALFSGNYNYLKEGANQALNRLVAYLEQAGHVVRVYSPVTDTPAFEPAGTLVPVPSVRMPVRGEFQLALGLPAAIRRDVERFRPDIVHVSTPDILGTRAQSLAIGLGVPIVASQHTLFETYLDYYRLGWAQPMLEAHLRRFYRRSDHVLVPTSTLATAMRHIRGDGRVTVWSRGVDRDLFNPARRDMAWRHRQGIADDETALLFFGRLVPEKGLSVFAATVEALRQRGLAVRPLLVGAGSVGGLFGACGGWIATGHLQEDDLARAVASADIMLTPSVTETFGNVVLEAMASGVPVVSADAPSARALIVDGHSGHLCPARDVEAYAATIERLIRAPDRQVAIGRAARAASAAYAWDAASMSVEAAYLRALEGRRRAA